MFVHSFYLGLNLCTASFGISHIYLDHEFKSLAYYNPAVKILLTFISYIYGVSMARYPRIRFNKFSILCGQICKDFYSHDPSVDTKCLASLQKNK